MDTVIDALSLVYDQAEYIVGDFYLVTLDNENKLYNAANNKLYTGYVDRVEAKDLDVNSFIVVAIEDRDWALKREDTYTTHIIYKTGEETEKAGLFRYSFSENGLDIFIKNSYTESYSEVLIVRQDDKSTSTHCKVLDIGVIQNDNSIYLKQQGENGEKAMSIIDREYNIINLAEYIACYMKKMIQR